MKIVIIDNYDSFTYNLAHLVRELGAEVTVLRNDQFRLEDLEAYSKIILSPGPGIPSEAGLLLDVIRTYAGRKPILGVCLGHQAIGEVFGGRLENLSDVFHGVATEGTQYENDEIFYGLPRRITILNGILSISAAVMAASLWPPSRRAADDFPPEGGRLCARQTPFRWAAELLLFSKQRGKDPA